MQYEFEIQDLTLVYPWANNKVFERLNLNIVKGQFHVLLGQNGTGKSSLIKCIAGLQPWKSGDILRNGKSRKSDSSDFNKDIFFISEDIKFPHFRVAEIALIYLEVWKRFDFDIFRRLIAIARINETMQMTQLSRGQSALVQVALALAVQPKVILIDEITAVLDPYVRNIVVGELFDYNVREAATIVIASNIATEFDKMDGRIILIDQGKLYLEGSFNEVVNKFVKIKVEKDARASVSSNFVEVGRAEDGARFFVGHRSEQRLDQYFFDQISLEDVFIFLTGRNK